MSTTRDTDLMPQRRPGLTKACRVRMRVWACALLFAAITGGLTLPQAALAQVVPAPPPLEIDRPGDPNDPNTPRDRLPADLQNVGVVEHLNEPVPLDLMFTDSEGNRVRLGDLLDGKRPVILNLGYYNCPMLCGEMWRGMSQTMREMNWTPGDDNYQVITLSINPRETAELAASKKRSMVLSLGRPEAAEGWHFLTGEEANILRLADAVGFEYQWIARQQEYAHPAVIMVLTPDGRVSRYLYGKDYPADLVRLSLVEASAGKVGSTVDRILLYCFVYDPSKGQYTWAAMALVQAGGVVTVATLVTAIGFMTVRDRRRRKAEEAAPVDGEL